MSEKELNLAAIERVIELLGNATVNGNEAPLFTQLVGLLVHVEKSLREQEGVQDVQEETSSEA